MLSRGAASCAEHAPTSAGVIGIPLERDTGDVKELGCTERSTDSSVRYFDPASSDPNQKPPDLTLRPFACVHTPSFGAPSDTIELVVAGLPTDPCVGLTHYILKGCREGPQCGTPDWDHSLAPPSWWPC